MKNEKPPVGEFDFSDVFVVIAAYNEDAAIGSVIQELLAICQNIIVVDDGSADATSKHAFDAGATVLRHPINRGQGAALQTGITHSLDMGARVVVTFDADGQHRASDLNAMVAPIVAGATHIVLGSRFLEDNSQIPARRRMLLKAGVVFTRITSGMRLTDTHNGLRAFSRKAAKQIDIQLDRMAHASEIIDQIRATGLPYLEVPVHVRYTEYSMAKGQSGGNAVRVAADYLLSKFLR